MTEGRESPNPEAPPRKTGKLNWRFSHEIEPNFWQPGLIDGVLELKGMTVVYGPSSCGKTAVVVDMACRIAAGRPWRGMKTTQGLVVYVAAENHWSTGNRVWAWRKQHGFKDGDVLPLAMVETPLQLGAEGAAEGILALVKEAIRESGQPCRLLVLDTLARTISGDESTAKDMGAYVQQIDRLKAGLDTHVLVIHHTGKDESRGARGSSALRAATDHEVELTKDVGASIGAMKLSKIREGGLEGKRFGYELKPREIGVNAYGRVVTTVVVQEAEPPVKMKSKTGHERLVEAFFAAAEGVVTFKALKNGVTLTEAGPGSGSERSAWKRLRDNGFISVDGDDIVTLS